MKCYTRRTFSKFSQKRLTRDITFHSFIGCTFEVYSDSEKNFLGLFCQDNYMKEDFQSYPEIIFIDATYKLTESRLLVYIFLVEDFMGESEIAGVGLLVSENAESLRWLLNAFKENNVNNSHVLLLQIKISTKVIFSKSASHLCLFWYVFFTLYAPSSVNSRTKGSV